MQIEKSVPRVTLCSVVPGCIHVFHKKKKKKKSAGDYLPPTVLQSSFDPVHYQKAGTKFKFLLRSGQGELEVEAVCKLPVNYSDTIYFYSKMKSL